MPMSAVAVFKSEAFNHTDRTLRSTACAALSLRLVCVVLRSIRT